MTEVKNCDIPKGVKTVILMWNIYYVSDFTENSSLNVINVKQYPVLRWVMKSLSIKHRRVMVLESDQCLKKACKMYNVLGYSFLKKTVRMSWA
jgi:hypothetical protein